MSKMNFYRCEKCGNMVAMVKNGGGTLVCCGQPMTKLEANTTDAAQEKHVPKVTREDGVLNVEVGSVLHPSLPEHYIEWIALVTEDQIHLKYLEPGNPPVAVFPDAEAGAVYEYCNIHGLWKVEF